MNDNVDAALLCGSHLLTFGNCRAGEPELLGPHFTLAFSIFPRIHGAPPNLVSLSRRDCVMRRETVTVGSSSDRGGRPWPRWLGGRFVSSMDGMITHYKLFLQSV